MLEKMKAELHSAAEAKSDTLSLQEITCAMQCLYSSVKVLMLNDANMDCDIIVVESMHKASRVLDTICGLGFGVKQ